MKREPMKLVELECCCEESDGGRWVSSACPLHAWQLLSVEVRERMLSPLTLPVPGLVQ